jgi:hypothetical protein
VPADAAGAGFGIIGPAMKTFVVALDRWSVLIRHPRALAGDLALLFGRSASRAGGEYAARMTVAEEPGGRFAIRDEAGAVAAGLSRHAALAVLAETVTARLAGRLADAVALHAGTVAWNGRTVLIPGSSGAGKSLLTAWLAGRGFDYCGDELAVLAANGREAAGFPRALMLKPDGEAQLASLPRLAGSAGERTEAGLILRPPEPAAPAGRRLPCGLILFVAYSAGAALSLTPVSPGRAALKLMACNVNAANLADGGLAAMTRLTRDTPAVELVYGAFDQLDGLADSLVKAVLDGGVKPAGMRRLASAFAPPPSPPAAPPAARYEVPEATPRRSPVKLTIGMATYDDYDGVYFSLQALRMYHPEIVGEAEFLVIDNHPDGPCGKPLKALEGHVPNYRYVPEVHRSGTAVRDRLFEEAAGEIVLCMDCHVFVVPGGVKRLLDYVESDPDTPDLLQGPLLSDNLRNLLTHFHPEWRRGMFGYWKNNGLADDLDAEPFEIPMQGLGLFACRRAAWLGFNPLFRGFGGEEGYIHEKFRRAGARTLCLPFLRWMHRFNRPLGVPYRNRWEDRIWNYLVGLSELGLPTDAMVSHFREILGEARMEAVMADLREQLAAAGLREVRSAPAQEPAAVFAPASI